MTPEVALRDEFVKRFGLEHLGDHELVDAYKALKQIVDGFVERGIAGQEDAHRLLYEFANEQKPKPKLKGCHDLEFDSNYSSPTTMRRKARRRR